MIIDDANLHYPWGLPPDGQDVLWRVEAKRFSYVIDAEAERYGVTDPRLEAQWYEVVRRTPQGAWLDLFTDRKFVLLTASKRFACNTVDEALKSFEARRIRQVGILQARLLKAEQDLALIQGYIKQVSQGGIDDPRHSVFSFAQVRTVEPKGT